MIVFCFLNEALDYLVMFVLICMKVNLAQIYRYKHSRHNVPPLPPLSSATDLVPVQPILELLSIPFLTYQ